MALRIVTQPQAEPLDLEFVKLYLRVDTDADDTLISSLIVAAREYCQAAQNRSYITQTWELTLDRFPHVHHARDFMFEERNYNRHFHKHFIKIPMPPIQSIVSITYTDAENNVTTLDPSTYVVDIDSEPGKIAPAHGYHWPTDHLTPLNGVRIRYTAGYGDAADAVPNKIKQAMLLLVSHWYENRLVVNDLRSVNPLEIGFTVTALLAQDRIIPV